MRSTRTLNRRFPAKGERRRNGLIIVDPKTGTEIHIRLQRGRDRNSIRLAVDADDHVVVTPEEKELAE
jgi:hypothetical protein